MSFYSYLGNKIEVFRTYFKVRSQVCDVLVFIIPPIILSTLYHVYLLLNTLYVLPTLFSCKVETLPCQREQTLGFRLFAHFCFRHQHKLFSHA